MPKPDNSLPRLGQGAYWQDISLGQRWRTFRRTVTETDLINFVSATGMLEAIFIDADFAGRAMPERAVPAALTYGLIEGFILQSLIQGTGLALLELHQKTEHPVVVGDTVWATVEITALRPTSAGNRAVVETTVEVFNDRDERVMTYEALRLLAGRPVD